MLFSFESLLIFTAAFAAVQCYIEHFSLKWAHAVIIGKFVNIIYGCCSGIFCCVLIYTLLLDDTFLETLKSSSVLSALSIRVPVSLDIFFCIYYLSKMWESLDIILVSLQGFPINIHFRVHHNTTPLLAWALLTHKSVGGIVFMILNTLMHFFVYLYFGGCNGSFLFYATRIFGHVQLILGMLFAGGTAVLYFKTPKESIDEMSQDVIIGSVLPFLLYAIYFILFQLEILDDAKAKLKAAKSKRF